MHPIPKSFRARLRRRAITATTEWTVVSLAWMAGTAAVVAADPADRAEPPTPVSFIRDVAPVLMDRCLNCHDEASAKGAYRLDTFEQMLVPGDSGRTPVVPGRPEEGSLYALLITDDPDDRMPRKGDPLEPAALTVIRRWIAEGAAFDGSDPRVAWIGEADAAALPLAPDTYAHPVPVSAAAVLPDGTVAVGGFREILLWSPEGRLIRRVSRVPERIQALVSRPDGAGLFFAGGVPGRRGAAGTVGMREEEIGEARQPFHRTGDTLLALAVAVTREGMRVAVAGTDRGIAIHEGPGLARVRTLGGHSDWVLDLAFDREGARLISAGRDRTARVHGVADGSLLAVFRDHSEAVTAAVFLPNGERVVTAGRDGRLRAWNPATGKDARASKPVGAQPTRLLVSGGRLWSAWSDGRIREHRADNLELVRELGEAGEPVLGLAMAGTGAESGEEAGPQRLIATRHDGWIQVWDPCAGTLRHTFLSVPPH